MDWETRDSSPVKKRASWSLAGSRHRGFRNDSSIDDTRQSSKRRGEGEGEGEGCGGCGWLRRQGQPPERTKRPRTFHHGIIVCPWTRRLLTGETACARALVRPSATTTRRWRYFRAPDSYFHCRTESIWWTNYSTEATTPKSLHSLSLSLYLLTTTTIIIMATVKQRFVCTLPRLVGLVRDCDNRGGQDSSGRTRIRLCREHVVICSVCTL